MRRWAVFAAMLAVPALGAALGHAAGPFLARAHRSVQLAESVLAEEAGRVKLRTFELDAYHYSGAQRQAVLDEAQRVERRFRIGGGILGVWVGLVMVAKWRSLLRPVRRNEYEADSGNCLSCGRCFLSCPRERVRLKNLAENKSGAAL